MADEHLGPVPDYHAEALRCRACQAREVKAAEISGLSDPIPLAGMKFSVGRNGNS
jgi:hypothetical protein